MHPLASAEIFSGQGQRCKFAYPSQVDDNAMQMDVHKTIYTFYPISLCWLNLNSQSFVWNVFYTLAIRNAISFHKQFYIHCFEHFLQSSHNLRLINSQNNMSGEKTRKLDTLAKLLQAMRSRNIRQQWQGYQTTYQRQYTTQALKKLTNELCKLATANLALHFVLTKKSEPNLNDKDVFPHVCIDPVAHLA